MAKVVASPRSSHTKNMEDVNKRCMFEIYLKEGKQLIVQKDYQKALVSLNQALDLMPNDNDVLLTRARCYLQMGRRLKALRDVEVVLDKDTSNPEALYAKAEILYQSGNYELSLIYFHRGLRQQPDSHAFREGIQKSQEGVLKFGGGPTSRGMRMSATGNISARRKQPSRMNQGDVSPPMSDRTHDRSWQQPSEEFPSTLYCPLARITKKPGLSHFRDLGTLHEKCPSEMSYIPEANNPSVDEISLRRILGGLYTDKKYLKQLQESLVGSQTSVTDLAESGVNYLQDRGGFWDKLGPLPPPQPNRRSYRKTGSTSSNSVYSFATNQNSLSSFRYSFKRKQSTKTVTSEELSFNFSTHEFDDCLSVAMETDSHVGERSVEQFLESEVNTECTSRSVKESETVPSICTSEPSKQDMTLEISREMEVIRRLYDQRRFAECQDVAGDCLAKVEQLNEQGITDKFGNLATLHSYLGNAAAARGNYLKAEYHHKKDLEICENDDMPELISRPLGNLGQAYISQRKHNKALDVLSRKVPLCSTPGETAWTFLEIGTCFLSLGHHDYAKDCGKKVLTCTRAPELDLQHFQAQLLVACAQEKMKQYDAAVISYKSALLLANQRGDRMAESAIRRALRKLERKLAFIKTKKKPYEQKPESKDANLSGNATEQTTVPPSSAGLRTIQTKNTSNIESDFEDASVLTVLHRLREETSSYSSYPVSEYQEDIDDTSSYNQSLSDDYSSGYIQHPTVKHLTSQHSSALTSNRRISFKLWNEGDNLFENDGDNLFENEGDFSKTGRLSTRRQKSNREKFALAIKNKAENIKYKKLDFDWTPTVIDTSRYSLGDDRDLTPRDNVMKVILTENSIIELGDSEPVVIDSEPDLTHLNTTEVLENETEIESNVAQSVVLDDTESKETTEHGTDCVTNESDDGDILKSDISKQTGPKEREIEVSFDDQHPSTLQVIFENDVLDSSEQTDSGDFLYPEDDVVFACPFDAEFSIEEEDIVMLTADHLTVEEGEGTGTSRRYSIVIPNVATHPETETSEEEHDLDHTGKSPTEEKATQKKKDKKDKLKDTLGPSVKVDDRDKGNAVPSGKSPKLSPRDMNKNSNTKAKDKTGKGKAETLKLPAINTPRSHGLKTKVDQTLEQPEDMEQTSTHDPADKNKKTQLFKSKYHEQFVKKPQDFGASEVDLKSKSDEVSLSEQVPLFKSKYHEQFAKKPQDIGASEVELRSKSEVSLSEQVPLFKSKYHEQFSKKSQDVSASQTELQSKSEVSLSDSGPIFKSKYHDIFTQKPDPPQPQKKYDPRWFLLPKLKSWRDRIRKNKKAIPTRIPTERSENQSLNESDIESDGEESVSGYSDGIRKDIKNQIIAPILKDHPFAKSMRSPRNIGTIGKKVTSKKQQNTPRKLKLDETKDNISGITDMGKNKEESLSDNEMDKKVDEINQVQYGGNEKRRYLYQPIEDSARAEPIKDKEIPPFIQKKKLVFSLSKKDGKVVFTPMESSESSDKWKVVYMRIRQGDKMFTVPVAQDPNQEQEADVKQKGGAKRRPRSYPIRLGTKKQFKFRMTSKLGVVPEGKEPKPSPRQLRQSRTTKPVVIPSPRRPSVRYKAAKIDVNFLSKLFEDGKAGKRRSFSLMTRRRSTKPKVEPRLKQSSDVKKEVGANSKNEAKPNTIRVPKGQQVVYEQTEREGKKVLVPVVKSAAHKIVLVRVKQKDKSYVVPMIVGRQSGDNAEVV